MNTLDNDAHASNTALDASNTALDVEVAGSWVTDKAWISGVAGGLAVVLCAYWYHQTDALTRGVHIAGFTLAKERLDGVLIALFLITGVMLMTEMLRLWLRDRQHFFRIDPDIKRGRYGLFVGRSVVSYLQGLGLLGLAILFFRTAGEYGFQSDNAYYQAWFLFLDWAWLIYLWGGVPYVLITRALKYDPRADRCDAASLLRSLVRRQFTEQDKKCARGLLVKLFFAPLMTAFFADQFPHLVSNIGYVLDTLPNSIANGLYAHSLLNKSFLNISISLIFSVDVALAWCGYVISSRWVDNQTISAEPTVLGWVVCVCCYPPFHFVLDLYYSSPGEGEFVVMLSNQWLITLFISLMVLGYFVYLSATLCFGARFSNLTNRGIIRAGPYSFVRHPAYISKNFAWWCAMLPTVAYNATHSNFALAASQVVGSMFVTWIYYVRALTEERHLSTDPHYLAYCQQVKSRFIPGVI